MKLDIQSCDWFFIHISDVPEYWYKWWQDKELHKDNFTKHAYVCREFKNKIWKKMITYIYFQDNR